MTIRSLAEVGARLEKAVEALPDMPASPAELYERYEMIAIQILDSEFDDFPEQVLLSHLEKLLAEKRRALGIKD